MCNRKLFELIILGLWLFIAIIITVDYGIKTKNIIEIPQNSLVLHPNNEIEIKKISVIHGDSFDLLLKDSAKSRILISLPVNAKEEAKKKVVELLKDSSSPRVVLYSKERDGKWLADLKFFFNEKEISLKDWLASNELVKEK